MQSAYNFPGRAVGQTGQSAISAFDNAVNTGLAWFDLALNLQQQLQKASLQAFSSYSPIANTRTYGSAPQTNTAATQANGVQVVAVGEERLNVATQTVPGETTRIRRRVVSQPVEQQVTLRDEKVIVERRRPAGAETRGDVLTETIIEVSDSRQVPTVSKSLHVAEEVVLRKQVTERVETVRETLRRDVVDVEHDRGTAETRTENLPARPQPTSLVPAEAAPRVVGQAAQAANVAEKKAAAPQPAGAKG